MTQAIGEQIAAGALAQLGVPFRLHGRNTATGLDCVGLVLIALRAAGLTIEEPKPYTVHGMRPDPILRVAGEAGLVPTVAAAPGDILLVLSGPLQLHLMVRCKRGLVHAHAGLGRVVLMPEPGPWPMLHAWHVPAPCPKES